METQINYSEEMVKKCDYLDQTGRIPYKQSTPYGIADFSQIYPFTTENINGYIKEFNLQDKSLLTVGSSGDQLINAILYGCKDITHFDINPYSKYYINLKLASILSLNKDDFSEFTSYFFPPNLDIAVYRKFRKDLYKKIRGNLKALDKEVFQTWESLFENYRPEIIKNALFSADGTIVKCDISRIIPYLSSHSAYEQTKANIKKADLSFLIGNITEAKFNRKFDNIWLSNIPQYLPRKDIDETMKNLIKYLNKDGKMLMAYIYNAFLPHNINYCPPAYKAYNPTIVQFGCCDQELYDKKPDEFDEVIIFNKKR